MDIVWGGNVIKMRTDSHSSYAVVLKLCEGLALHTPEATTAMGLLLLINNI